jgi:hypothetical protein
MGATAGFSKVYKHSLGVRGDIKCSHCPYNRRENAKRKPRTDTHKNHRRKS